jgi:hypothetical protein
VLSALGKTGDFKDGVLKVNIPRNDLRVTINQRGDRSGPATFAAPFNRLAWRSIPNPVTGKGDSFLLLPVGDCVLGLVDGLIDLLPGLLGGSLFRTRTGRDGDCQQRSDDDEATDDFHARIMTTLQHSRLSDSVL